MRMFKLFELIWICYPHTVYKSFEMMSLISLVYFEKTMHKILKWVNELTVGI